MLRMVLLFLGRGVCRRVSFRRLPQSARHLESRDQRDPETGFFCMKERERKIKSCRCKFSFVVRWFGLTTKKADVFSDAK